MATLLKIPGHDHQKAGEVSLDEIRAVMGDCRLCPLGETRKNIVFGSGNPHARVVLVGEAPGATEDEMGLPFVGRAGELLDEGQPDFDPLLDPKCCWALRHPDFFPVEVNRADYEALLRVPGIGVVSAKRILVARRGGALRAEDLKKLGVVLKRAQYFLTCSGRSTAPLRLSLEGVRRNLTATERASLSAGPLDQLSLFEPA